MADACDKTSLRSVARVGSREPEYPMRTNHASRSKASVVIDPANRSTPLARLRLPTSVARAQCCHRGGTLSTTVPSLPLRAPSHGSHGYQCRMLLRLPLRTGTATRDATMTLHNVRTLTRYMA